MHLDTATNPLPGSAGLSKRSYRDRFFVGFAVAATASVLIGFARTYYLKSIFALRPFPLLFHIHGALFTGWLFLLVLQTLLVSSGRTARHRRVGSVGQFMVVPILVTGTLVSIAAARGEAPLGAAVRAGELTWVELGITPAELLFSNLVSMFFFGVFTGAGLVLRRSPNAHKRFMVLATIVLLPAAIGRALITILGVFHPAVPLVSTALLVLSMAIYDRRSRGRVHGVTLWGGLALMVSFPPRLLLAKTDLWLGIAAWLIH